MDKIETSILPISKEISKYPPIRRDIAVVVPNELAVQTLLTCMYAEKESIVTEIALFDIYRGKGMTDNEKSLAFRMLLQDTEKTLTDIEADLAVTKLINILENQFGAKLRH